MDRVPYFYVMRESEFRFTHHYRFQTVVCQLLFRAARFLAIGGAFLALLRKGSNLEALEFTERVPSGIDRPLGSDLIVGSARHYCRMMQLRSSRVASNGLVSNQIRFALCINSHSGRTKRFTLGSSSHVRFHRVGKRKARGYCHGKDKFSMSFHSFSLVRVGSNPLLFPAFNTPPQGKTLKIFRRAQIAGGEELIGTLLSPAIYRGSKINRFCRAPTVTRLKRLKMPLPSKPSSSGKIRLP